jgi:hypothetical protein
MKLEIIWNFPALAALYRIPWRTAETVDRAVIRFAERGEGRIEWIAPHYRLRAAAYEMAIVIDRQARTLTVLRLYRARL